MSFKIHLGIASFIQSRNYYYNFACMNFERGTHSHFNLMCLLVLCTTKSTLVLHCFWGKQVTRTEYHCRCDPQFSHPTMHHAVYKPLMKQLCCMY